MLVLERARVFEYRSSERKTDLNIGVDPPNQTHHHQTEPKLRHTVCALLITPCAFDTVQRKTRSSERPDTKETGATDHHQRGLPVDC